MEMTKIYENIFTYEDKKETFKRVEFDKDGKSNIRSTYEKYFHDNGKIAKNISIENYTSFINGKEKLKIVKVYSEAEFNLDGQQISSLSKHILEDGTENIVHSYHNEYDDKGRILKSKSLKREIEYIYNNDNNTYTVKGPDFEEYYENNYLMSHVYRNSKNNEVRSTKYEYKGDKIVKVTHTETKDDKLIRQKIENYIYGKNCKIITIINTRFEDDEQITKEISTCNLYDDNNNIILHLSSDGSSAHFKYDNKNRLITTSELFEDGEFHESYICKYDENDNVIYEFDLGDLDETFFEYMQIDGQYKLSKQIVKYIGEDENRIICTIEYKYDENGNKIEESYTYNDRIEKIVYEYDDENRVLKEVRYDIINE